MGKGYKRREAEDYLDWYFYRVLASYIVDWVKGRGFVPDDLTWLSLIFGVMGGIFLYFEELSLLVIGVILLMISNVLDCSDGQLARLKGIEGGLRGRAFDGLVDGLVVFSIYLFSVLKLYTEYYVWWIWLIGWISGFSYFIQSALFDYYRNQYIDYIDYGIEDKIEDKIEEEAIESFKPDHLWDKILMQVNSTHIFFQEMMVKEKNLTKKERFKNYNRVKNQRLLRLWTYIGTTSHLSYIIIFTLLERMDIYFIMVITVGNLYMIILNKLQKGKGNE